MNIMRISPQKYEDRVNNILQGWHCPGVAIAVIHGDETSCRGFGRATAEPEKLVTADTIFDIASSSKSLTAAAVAVLVEDDVRFPEVNWNAKMSDLLPNDFVMAKESYTKDVSVEDILSHRTGLAAHDISYLSSRARQPDTPRSVTRNLRNLEISKPIRSQMQYSNMMYTVATHLVESKSGQSFSEFLRNRILDPLGMKSTHLQPSAVSTAGLESRLVTPYAWDAETETYRTVKCQEVPEAQGAGAIHTSANDYILWVQALLNHTSPMITPIVKSIRKPRIICDPDDTPGPGQSHALYAAGLEIQNYRGHQIFKHDGRDPGVGSLHFFVPALKFGAVLFGNCTISAPAVTHILGREIIDAAIGVPEAERTDWEMLRREEGQAWRGAGDKRIKEMLGFAGDAEMPDEAMPLERELSSYVGVFENVGYHELEVQIKDEQLFIDATDRTMGFWMTLRHVGDGERFLGETVDYYDETKGSMAVRFRVKGDTVLAIGVDFEDSLDGLIWFDRVQQ